MDKKIDLRITRTQKMIKDAFFELMDTIGFDKITVQNLTSKAMVSRTTFYLHYKDKYDLLDQIEGEIFDGFVNIGHDIPIDEITRQGLTHERATSFLYRIYEYVSENRTFFKLIMGEKGDPSFYYKLSEVMKATSPLNIHPERLRIPEHYAVAFVIGVQTSIINEWLKSDLKETPAEIVSMIVSIMDDVPRKMYK